MDGEEGPGSGSGPGRLLAVLAFGLVGCAEAQVKPVALLFEGDSDIEGWDTSAYPDSANVGVGGAVCRDVFDTLEDTLQAYQPTRVVLVCGENDLWGQGVRRTFDDFSAVVSRIHQTGATVVYMGTKPEPATTELHGDYRAYDDRIRQYALALAAVGDTPLTMIDVYPSFEDLGNPDELYRRDRLHLSKAGYALWDAWLSAALSDNDCVVWQGGVCQHTAGP